MEGDASLLVACGARARTGSFYVAVPREIDRNGMCGCSNTLRLRFKGNLWVKGRLYCSRFLV